MAHEQEIRRLVEIFQQAVSANYASAIEKVLTAEEEQKHEAVGKEWMDGFQALMASGKGMDDAAVEAITFTSTLKHTDIDAGVLVRMFGETAAKNMIPDTCRSQETSDELAAKGANNLAILAAPKP